ncbi:MAG: DUF3127 domain-containing protein [Bacteroidales bacterium]|jgi:hypothetical protein|nr:DUF3127 domain-containing protein [Bacteroidales bacterium]
MEITGKIIRVLALQQGEGKNGPWKKQEYVIETSDKIPRKVCFSLWGDKVDQFRLTEGAEAGISFDLESREYNGRWYTDVKAWKVTKKQPAGNAADSESQIQDYSSGMPPEDAPPDDLPF